MELGLVRQMWQLLEPIHATLYYAPEVTARAEALGFAVDTRWPSYFPLRSAPLGAAGPELVAATFYSFDPDMVRSHVAKAWQVAAPQAVLEARLAGVDAALGRILGDRVSEPGLAEAATLARRLAEAAPTGARPLAAASADLPWPVEPHLVLWQAATILREHRGDGHVAALLLAGLDPVESLVSFAAVGAAPVEVFASRGWPESSWSAATSRLVERGWLDPSGTATSAGRAGRDEVERHTDELAAAPYRALGAESAGRLAELVVPVTMAVVGTGMLPRQSTLGINRK
jgi:helix-turn-helix protein